ncbi:LRR receptor-like serine threonine-protein kinase [Seminavis robusta]|uniref:LRR receptor-like serine threonine-protein kinase n=1 Tax=Seminavis robusta TaxID=568900 RepID=A0A9N8DXT4_9STRA|nr:LRR receptor-like serine threonine-protein kinase [Seminavis robusta]|eukprot:Sro449_g145280.1 LRR receptor-like serine threonine-protein kinase (343) ;mRNA; f:18756-19784
MVVLSVSDLELAGYQPRIPPELSLMTGLKEIHIFFNDISTSVQAMIPSQLYMGMPQLRTLNFMFNSLSGSIPTDIGLVSDLMWLNWDFNLFLTGTLPSELALLTKLTRLSLPVNSLSSTIPSELGSLASLVTLNLEHLSLTGAIPRETGMLSNLEGLSLNNNALSGNLPSHLGLLTGLQRLDCAHNLLSSTIPSDIAGLSQLEMMDLSDNALSSLLLGHLGMLDNLQELDLGSNQFWGVVPSEWGSMTGLRVLDLSNLPSLSGTLPIELSWLASMYNLSRLNLGGSSNLQGVLSEDLCDLLGESCNYTFSGSWYAEKFEDCSLEFDCTEKLCGCGCNCTDSA